MRVRGSIPTNPIFDSIPDSEPSEKSVIREKSCFEEETEADEFDEFDEFDELDAVDEADIERFVSWQTDQSRMYASM